MNSFVQNIWLVNYKKNIDRNVMPPIRDNNYLNSIPGYFNPKFEIGTYQNLDSISDRIM